MADSEKKRESESSSNSGRSSSSSSKSQSKRSSLILQTSNPSNQLLTRRESTSSSSGRTIPLALALQQQQQHMISPSLISPSAYDSVTWAVGSIPSGHVSSPPLTNPKLASHATAPANLGSIMRVHRSVSHDPTTNPYQSVSPANSGSSSNTPSHRVESLRPTLPGSPLTPTMIPSYPQGRTEKANSFSFKSEKAPPLVAKVEKSFSSSFKTSEKSSFMKTMPISMFPPIASLRKENPDFLPQGDRLSKSRHSAKAKLTTNTTALQSVHSNSSDGMGSESLTKRKSIAQGSPDLSKRVEIIGNVFVPYHGVIIDPVEIVIVDFEEKRFFPQTSKTVLKESTIGLLNLFRRINPEFDYNSSSNPKRILTKPSNGTSNDGFDNENNDLILSVNFVLYSENHPRARSFRVVDVLGQGTFGQVVKCENLETHEFVAVKVIKNKPAYYSQSHVEIRLLEMINGVHDPDDRSNMIRLKDHFVFKDHLCMVFEMLDMNLYELIRQNRYRGLSWNLIRTFTKQILNALIVLRKAKIIHCDLKPENVLLVKSDIARVKVIDFSSSCLESETTFSYIQSRFYRSPEVLLGLPYSSPIDMWSLGCITAELFLGLPLFPGCNEHDQIGRIIELQGSPPTEMLESGKNVHKFFNRAEEIFTFKTKDQFLAENSNVTIYNSKRYFKGSSLEEVINFYPVKKDMTQKEKRKEKKMRQTFFDFLSGLMRFNPNERWTPVQAIKHPFITEEEFTGPFVPPVDPAQFFASLQVSRSDNMQIPSSAVGGIFAFSPPHGTSDLGRSFPDPLNSSFGSWGVQGSFGAHSLSSYRSHSVTDPPDQSPSFHDSYHYAFSPAHGDNNIDGESPFLFPSDASGSSFGQSSLRGFRNMEMPHDNPWNTPSTHSSSVSDALGLPISSLSDGFNRDTPVTAGVEGNGVKPEYTKGINIPERKESLLRSSDASLESQISLLQNAINSRNLSIGSGVGSPASKPKHARGSSLPLNVSSESKGSPWRTKK